jgi:hypothetical protein
LKCFGFLKRKVKIIEKQKTRQKDWTKLSKKFLKPKFVSHAEGPAELVFTRSLAFAKERQFATERCLEKIGIESGVYKFPTFPVWRI